MDQERRQELYHLVEACRDTDNGDLEAEKTAAIEELLMEIERMENGIHGGEAACRETLMDNE